MPPPGPHKLVSLGPPGKGILHPRTEKGVLGAAVWQCYRDQILDPTYGTVWYSRFGEPSGTNINDEIGTNDGTVNGAPTLGATGALLGDSNTAISFASTGADYILVPDAPALDVGNVFSITFWVKWTAGVAGYLISKGDQFQVLITSNQIRLGNDAVGAMFTTAGPQTGDGLYHHWAIVRYGTGSGQTVIYKDGQYQPLTDNNPTLTLISDASDMNFGRYGGGGIGVTATLDEPAIHNIPLTPSQVMTLVGSGPVACVVSSFNQDILPTGIASAEAFGTHTLLPGNAFILPASVASGEAFGTHVLTAGTAQILPAGISSAETFGAHTLLPGNVAILPAGIGSAEAVGTHVLKSNAYIRPASIADQDYIAKVTTDGATHLWALDEAGSTATDLIGGKNGTYTGGGLTQSVSGPPQVLGARAVRIPAADGNYVDFADGSGLPTVNDNRTWDLWYRANNTNANKVLFGYGTNGVSGQQWVEVLNYITDIAISFYGLDNGVAAANADDGDWHHLAVTWDHGPGTAEFWLDGVSKGTYSPGGGIATTLPGSFRIGALYYATGFYFDGDLALLASYETKLTQAQIEAHAAGGAVTGVGNHTLVQGAPAAVTINPSSIASAEAFGTHVLFHGNVNIVPASIASAEAVGSHTLVHGNVNILPSAIASAEAFGSHTLKATANILPTSIASAEAFGSHTLIATANILPASIASAEAFGTHVLKSNANILPTAIGSAEAFGSHVLVPGQASIQITAIPSAEAFGSHTLRATATISPVGIASAETFGSHTLIAGNVNILPTGIASAETFGSHTLKATANIIVASIASAEIFGSHTLRPGNVNIVPSAIASAEAFGSHTLRATANILPASIASAETFGTHVLRPGNVAIVVGGIPSAEAFGTPDLTNLVKILPTSINSAELFGSHTVLHGNVSMVAQSIGTQEALGTHALLHGTVAVLPTAITSAENVPAPVLIARAFASVESIPSEETFGPMQLSAGPAFIQAAGISSAEAFGQAVLAQQVLVSPGWGWKTTSQGFGSTKERGSHTSDGFGSTKERGSSTSDGMGSTKETS